MSMVKGRISVLVAFVMSATLKTVQERSVPVSASTFVRCRHAGELGPAAGPAGAHAVPARLDRTGAGGAPRRHGPHRPQGHRAAAVAGLPGRRGSWPARALPA